MSPSWYDLLDVEQDASTDEIRAAWRRAIDGLEPTDRRFAIRNQAAAVLLDPAKRAAYDAELADEGGTAVEPPVQARPARPAVRQEPDPTAARSGSRTMTVPAPTRRTTTLEPDDSPARTPVRARARTAAGATPADKGATPPSIPGWLLVGLAVVLALVGVLAGYLLLNSEPDGAVDDAAVAARQTAERAVPAVFSYDFHDIEGSRSAAESFMTDGYRDDKFDPVFQATVAANAKTIRPVVTSTLVDSAVTNAQHDRVDVLVFFNQRSVTVPHPEPQLFLNYATLRMKLVDGEWLLDQIITKPIG